MDWLIRALLLCCAGLTVPALSAAAAGSLQQDLVFSGYCAQAGGAEIVHRLLSPLASAEVDRSLAATHAQLPTQALDLARETFTLYVPAAAPAQGYGLLVFVPPWPQARLPKGWEQVLDRYGLIVVTAAGSGNEASVLARRAPLALLGACNVLQRYPVDPGRIYVAGFSGGARVALRLALAYPDLFRGALLNAGSDPIDGTPVVAPKGELLQRFQESVRLVYATGEHDSASLADVASLASLHHWCAFDTQTQLIPGAGHEVMSAVALDHALQALATHAPADPARLSTCRASLTKEIADGLQEVTALAAAGRQAQARKLLVELDRRFGGAAAPASVALEAQLGEPPPR